MAERIAMIWAFSLLGLLAAAFGFDMLFGPYVLRRVPTPEAAFVIGGIYATIMIGPLLIVALVRS